MTIVSESGHVAKVGAFVAVSAAIAIPFRISGVSAQQSILVLALLGALFLSYKEKSIWGDVKEVLISRVGKFTLSIFVFWTVTLPFSHNPVKSLEIGGRTGLFLFAALIIGSVLKQFPNHHPLMWKTLVTAAISLGIAALTSLLGLEVVLETLLLRFEQGVQPNAALKAYTTASVCLLPVVLYAGHYLGGRWKAASHIYPLITVGLILLTQTRSAMAGLLMMLVLSMVLVAFAKRKYIKFTIASIILTLTIGLLWVRADRIVYVTHFEKYTYLPGWLIDPHRQQIWKFAAERFLDHPFVGNGIDQLNRLPGADRVIKALGDSAHVVPAHPHNWALEILSETGLVGFLPVLTALVVLSLALLRDYLRTRSEASGAQLMLLVGFWTCSMFSFSIWAVWWQLVLYILFAMIYASKQQQPPL